MSKKVFVDPTMIVNKALHFPFQVTLRQPSSSDLISMSEWFEISNPCPDGDWSFELVDHGETASLTYLWDVRFFFKHETDAIAFKLKFS